MPPKRPFGVTLFLCAVLMLSAWGMIRIAAALRWWDVLHEFNARLDPLYLSITGAVWGVAGGVLFWMVLNRKPGSRMAVLTSTLVWQAELWIERLFLPSSASNLPFAITASCVLIGVIIVTTLHRSTQYYLNKSEEHEQPDQHPKTA
jgi:hypothetical protein